MTSKDEIDKSIEHVTDQEREHAQNALNEFNKKSYTGCLQIISKLEKRTDDYKVLHNKHVVEYYKSDMKKTDQFQKNINTIFKQFNLKADKLDDVDHCVMYFNQAVLLYHQKHYTQSLNIMDRVYKFIEPLDETIGRQVGLLLLELYICVRQIDKAHALLVYLRNHIVNQNQPLPTIKILSKNAKAESKKTDLPNPETEAFLKKLDVYEIRCNLLSHCLTKSRERCLKFYNKDDLKNISGIFLMANQEYLEGNFSKAEKLLLSIPNDGLKYSECGESSSVMVNNNIGVLYHAQGKPNLASHYFQKALNEDVNISKTIANSNDKALHTLGGSKYHEIMYNLGISLLHAGKPTQAFDYLIIAVRRYHRNSPLWLRLAECCISAHRPSNESEFDISKAKKGLVVDVIGEGEHQKVILTSSVSNENKYSSTNTSYAVPVPTLEFASLCLRNALLLLPNPPPPPTPTTTAPQSTSDSTSSSSSPSSTLLVITPDARAAAVAAAANMSVAAVAGVPPGCAPSAPLTAAGVCSLRSAILVAGAYVALHLGDFVLALEQAEAVLKVDRLAGVHKLLGHLYAAEALIAMDKISVAIDHLNPKNIEDISLELPPKKSSKTKENDTSKTCPPAKWFPTNMESALTVLKYNLAVAKAIRGQLDQASDILKQIWKSRTNDIKVPAHILMLVIYIELQLGHIDAARSLIKQYSVHRFKT